MGVPKTIFEAVDDKNAAIMILSLPNSGTFCCLGHLEEYLSNPLETSSFFTVQKDVTEVRGDGQSSLASSVTR